MEDEHQKMMALKKAYADIILNTVKEAAARVMVSERKALCLQQELCSVKDEALRMLLRLKNMIDSKMHEGDLITSLCQRKKIEDLEAQLHGAEDVITDLRMQLKEAQNHLEKEKKDKLQPLERKIMNKITFSSRSTLELDSSRPSSSELQTVSSNLKNMKMEQIAHAMYNSLPKSIEHSSVSQVEIVHSHDSDSASTIVGIKEHRLSSKRCTKIIRSLERNFLDYSLPLGIDVKGSQVLEGKEPSVKGRDKEERGLSARIGKTDIQKNVHGAVLKRPVKLHTLRRMSRFGKCKTGSCRLHGSQLTKPHHPTCIISLCRPHLKDDNVRSDKSEYRPSLMADSENATQNSRLLEEHKIDSYKDASGISNGGQPKGNMERGNLNGFSPDQPINPCDKSSVLSPCVTSINLVNDDRKAGEDHSNITKHQRKIKKLTCLDPGLTPIGSYVDSTSVPPSVTASAKVNKSRVQNAANSKKDLMALSVKQESDEIRNLIFPSSKLNSEMNSNTKCEQICEVTNYSPCKVVKKMFLRCTRQSKRKREPIGNSDENLSPGKSNAKRRLGKKLKFDLEFEKSNLIRESTRESRQLSQVARQLISLSRKRWE